METHISCLSISILRAHLNVYGGYGHIDWHAPEDILQHVFHTVSIPSMLVAYTLTHSNSAFNIRLTKNTNAYSCVKTDHKSVALNIDHVMKKLQGKSLFLGSNVLQRCYLFFLAEQGLLPHKKKCIQIPKNMVSHHILFCIFGLNHFNLT